MLCFKNAISTMTYKEVINGAHPEAWYVPMNCIVVSKAQLQNPIGVLKPRASYTPINPL
jgi:hypothetical protein